jgi:hypothetical protein
MAVPAKMRDMQTSANFRKTKLTRWRDGLLALGLLLLGGRLLSVSIHAHGHEIVCLILQISAGAVLLAAAVLSLLLLSAPTLVIDKFGVCEHGFLWGDFNWNMTWNEIAYAELCKGGHRLMLIGLESDEVEHTLSGYEHFEVILKQIRNGLSQYGRRLVGPGQHVPSYSPK